MSFFLRKEDKDGEKRQGNALRGSHTGKKKSGFRCCGRENYGTMIKRYDPIGFNVGYREWVEQPGRRVVRGLLQWPHGHWQQAHRRHGSGGN